VILLARGIDKFGIKKIIDELRKEPLNWVDLKALVNLPESTLNRYLGYLEFWGLAKKNNAGCWDWHERVRTYETEHDYSLAIKHSERLMNTLKEHFGASMINPEWFQEQAIRYPKARGELILIRMVREHLKTGYPSLFAEVVNFDKLVKLNKTLALELQTQGSKIDAAKRVEYVANFRSLKEYAIPKKYRKEVEKIIASIEPERLDFIEQTRKNYIETLLKIDNELRRLIFTVENGEPLLGICDLCPRSKVLN
jgi:hypothetical protein